MLAVIYFVSHVYDYLFYPVYWAAHHPWVVRRYNRANHARREDRPGEGCVIFHSLVEPGEKNVELERFVQSCVLSLTFEAGICTKYQHCRNELNTMDKVLDHVCERHEEREALGTRVVLGESEERQPNGKVFRKYELGDFSWRTFAEFAAEARAVAGSMRRLGLGAGSRIAILAETRAEWMITAYACFLNNVALVTLYTNLGNSSLEHALNETEVAFVVCSMETLAKVKAVRPNCPKLNNIILMSSVSPEVKSASAKRDLLAADSRLRVVLYEELCAPQGM